MLIEHIEEICFVFMSEEGCGDYFSVYAPGNYTNYYEFFLFRTSLLLIVVVFYFF